jgi:DNA-binding NtrC family response regulator
MELAGTGVLLVDEDRFFLRGLARTLTAAGLSVHTAASPAEATRLLQRHTVDLLLGDVSDDFLRALRRTSPGVLPIVLATFPRLESAVRAVRAGAFDYLGKPIDDARLLDVLRLAVQQLRFSEGNSPVTTSLLGGHPSIAKLVATARSVAASRTTVLITGESGTGKSLLAKLIHDSSPRAEQPFGQLSCGSLSETLLESELFGHVKGAFTGATSDKQGRFLAADEGTLFLDEINSASPAMQVKLLRAIQERSFEPVGSAKTETVDVRLILAANADLAQLVSEGRFREDLFYRINVVPLHLPPLRERATDVPLLANAFLRRFAKESNRQILGFAPAALEALQAYRWPGNVRELENAIERAVVLSHAPTLTLEDLPESITQRLARPPTAEGNPRPLYEALETPERTLIEQALERNRWNRNQTAAELRIDRTTLYKKMRKYRIGA